MNYFKEQFNLAFPSAPNLDSSFLVRDNNIAADNNVIDKVQKDLFLKNNYLSFIRCGKDDTLDLSKICYNYTIKTIYLYDPCHFASIEAFYSCLFHEFGHVLCYNYDSPYVAMRKTISYCLTMKEHLESVLINELCASILSFHIAKYFELGLDYSEFINFLVRAFKGYWNHANNYLDFDAEYIYDAATKISDNVLKMYKSDKIHE